MDITENKKGIAEIFPNLPFMKICDTLFIFDIDKEISDKIKMFLDEHDISSINIFQLNIYRELSQFEEGLTLFYEYAIFDNQNLCENVTVMVVTDEFESIAKKVIKNKSTAITKFNGRKWPLEDNCIKFEPLSGSGSISPGPKFVDPKKIVSWFWVLEHKDEYDVDTSDPVNPIIYDKNNPDDQNKLIPGVEIIFPENPFGSLYELKYFYNFHTTTFDFDENISRILPGMAMTNSSKQNKITIVVMKPVRCSVITIVDDAESYIYNKRSRGAVYSSYPYNKK